MIFAIPDLSPAGPEIFVLVMACIVLLVGVFVKDNNQVLTYSLTQLTLVGAAILTFTLYQGGHGVTFNNSFILDRMAILLKAVMYGLTFVTLLYSRSYMKDRDMLKGEYYALALFTMLGMMVVVSAYSFITLYLGLELFSLPLYALVAFRRNETVCAEAGMKYFVLGAVASGMLLYGLSMIYGATHSLTINAVAQGVLMQPVDQQLILLFGLVFVVVGISFKLGAVPFHMWVPDVYQGAPNSVTLFVSTAPKLAAFGLAIRLLVDALPLLQPHWQDMLMIVAILSMALGNLVAIVQTNIKRMLAYSSIAHMGYMFLGLVAGTPSGYGAALFYMISYSVMSLGAFGVIVLMSHQGFEAESIEDFKGLNQRSPWLAFIMLLTMFSMAGIPPIVGFFAKVAVLEALINVHLIWLAALALGFAIIGMYYYLKVVKVMYFDTASNSTPIVLKSFDTRLAISVNGLLVLMLGLFPSGLFDLCRDAF